MSHWPSRKALEGLATATSDVEQAVWTLMRGPGQVELVGHAGGQVILLVRSDQVELPVLLSEVRRAQQVICWSRSLVLAGEDADGAVKRSGA